MELALLQIDQLQTATSSFFLWFTTGGMFLGTVLFLYWATTGQPGNYHHYVASAVITLWASMMYIVMATGGGATLITEPGGEIRIFYFARYIDWTLTTPLLLLGLAWVALGSLGRNPGLVWGLVIADVAMILTGVLSGAWAGGFKWFWFAVSCIAFLAVLALIWGPLQTAAQSGVSPEASLFYPLAIMLTVLWFAYPVVFLIGTEGIGAIPIGFEVFLFAVLDITAKVGFGIVLLGGIRRLTEQGGRQSARA
jgi:bacteriorhodopsin